MNILADTAKVFEYLGRYSHCVAISNHRITSIADGKVTFTAKNSKKKKTYPVSLDATEFLRRFSLHILPPNFMKIRFFGFLSNTNKRWALKTIRKSIGQHPPAETNEDEPKAALVPGPLPQPKPPP